MRLFLTSYQKSGTHQIRPALKIESDIVGRGYVDMARVKGYGDMQVNPDGIIKTCKELREFKHARFGHLPYLPEYAEALQAQPTKVIFNVRDPRDIVIANHYSIQKVYYGGQGGLGHLNLMDEKTGEFVACKKDPISALIEIESYRWPAWLGWLDQDFVMQVKYEDLRLDGIETIKRMAEFLDPYLLDIDSTFIGLIPRFNNPTFRAGRVGDWKFEFKEHHKKLAEKLMGETITRLGYEL